jgi:hypothetical protein
LRKDDASLLLGENVATKKTAKTTKSRAGRTSTAEKTNRSPKSGLSKTTTDHTQIQRWAEARNATPVRVKRTGRSKDDLGIIRLDFPGYSGAESLEPVSWDEFFEAFDENRLAFIYQEKTASGRRSNFNKFISREA